MYLVALIIKHKFCFDVVRLADNGGLAAVIIKAYFYATAALSVQVDFETSGESLWQNWSRRCFQNITINIYLITLINRELFGMV